MFPTQASWISAYRTQLRSPRGWNLAGWDNEPRISPREEAQMTFTYAVIADGGIVLCADSQITHTHTDQLGAVIGTYKGRRGKIRRIGGRFAFSIAGSGGLVDTLLAEAEQSQVEKLGAFEDVVRGYRGAFVRVLERDYADGAERMQIQNSGVGFLFCGFGGRLTDRIPEVVKLDIHNGFLWNPITGRDYAATGAAQHGAAYYLHHRFYRDGMPLEQAKLLAYCIAAEVADLDNTVGGPIEMEIITPERSDPATGLEKYQRAREDFIGMIRSYLADFK